MCIIFPEILDKWHITHCFNRWGGGGGVVARGVGEETAVFSENSFIFNPFKPNGISHSYQLNQSLFILRVFGWYFFSFLFKF